MTEAERQSRAHAEVRARLLGKPVRVNLWSQLAAARAQRNAALKRSRFAELKQETRDRKMSLSGIRLETFRTSSSAAWHYDATLSAMITARYTQRFLDPELIAASILVEYPGFGMDQIRGPRGPRELVFVRHRIIGEIRRLRPDMSLVAIGKFMHRDHSAVIYALGRKKPRARKEKQT